MMADPIVITGAGLVAPMGLSVGEVFEAIAGGKVGMGPIPAVESVLPVGSTGGQAPELPGEFMEGGPREVRYLRWVLLGALRQAGLGLSRDVSLRDLHGRDARDTTAGSTPLEPRCQLVLGTTLHGMRAAGSYLRTGGREHLRKFLAGDTARLASEGLGFERAMTTCSACSSSLGAVALGVTMLKAGEAEVVVAGGYDTLSEYAWGGFNALRVVSPGELTPFVKGRLGMKLSEGYGVVVLEKLSRARARGAQVLAVVAGYGESADAFHLTRPEPGGSGALAAMRAAVRSAGIEVGEIGIIAAHATGTGDNDSSEAQAMGALGYSGPVVAFKSQLGHTLGGAGAVELILAMEGMRRGLVPPTAGVAGRELEFPVLVSGEARRREVKYTLNTSLGFGGANTCVVLKRAGEGNGDYAEQERDTPATKAVVTGVGVLLPAEGEVVIKDSVIEGLVNARRVRRMSPYVKISLAVASLAISEASLKAEDLVGAQALLGTMHGSTTYCREYYSQIVKEGVLAANPMLFAEGVPNAAAAQLSLMLGMKGACQTIIGTRSAALDALDLARMRVENGEAERVIVVAAEEWHESVDEVYRWCLGERFRPTMAGGVAMVVESDVVAEKRGVKGVELGPVPGTAASLETHDLFSVEGLLEVARRVQAAKGAVA